MLFFWRVFLVLADSPDIVCTFISFKGKLKQYECRVGFVDVKKYSGLTIKPIIFGFNHLE